MKSKVYVLAALALAAGCSSSPKGTVDAGPSDGGTDLAAGDAPVDLVPPGADGPDGGAHDVGQVPEGGDAAPEVVCAPWTGDRQFGTANDDAVLALAASANGAIVGGYVGGVVGGTDIEPVGNARGFVRALSTSGEARWETFVDATGTETIEAVAISPTGEIGVAGRTTGAFPGSTNRGKQDAFAGWLSPTGALTDVRQFGDERPQHPRRVIFTPTGLAVSGFDDIFIDGNYVASWENAFFAAIEATPGAAPVFRPDRTSQADIGDGIALDPLGSGDFFQAGVLKEGAQRGLFVRRFGSDGALRWQKRLSTIGLEVAGPLLTLPDGTLWLAAGWFRATSGTDVVLLSLDPSTGQPVKAFDFPTADGAEEVNALARDRRGDFWIAGSVVGRAFAGAPAAGEFDAFVLHVSADGAFLDGWQRGTPGGDYASALTVDACGNVIVGGATDGALLPGAASLGGVDAFVMRVPLEVRR